MTQELPFHDETARRFLGRSAGTPSTQLWGELEIMHPGDPKAQLQTWIDQTAEQIGTGGHVLDHGRAEADKLYREEMVRLCRRAGLAQPDAAAELLILMSEGAKAARQYEGPKEPSERFRRVAEATVSRFSQRRHCQITGAR